MLTLPEAGHVAMMEYPERVAVAFRDLLRDTEAEASAVESVSAGAGPVPGVTDTTDAGS